MGLIMNGNDWMTGGSYSRTSTNHTVMYWLRLDSNAAVRRPFGNTGAWEARTGSGSSVLISDYLQSGTLGTVTLTVGVFAHVAFVQSVSTSQRFAYLNGTLVGTVNSASFSGTQTGNIMIGVTPGGSGQGWFGVIDDIRVYNRVMPQDEIQTIHACRGRDGIVDSLNLWYPLNEGAEGATASTVVDHAGVLNLNLSTVNNTPQYNYDAGITFQRGVL